jgi:hypothetical protein
VSLKGYSRDGNGMLVLIYEEFFQNRSLDNYLKGIATTLLNKFAISLGQ